MMVNYRAMGQRVRAARKRQHMTQQALAEKADISLSFLGHIERGTRIASVETLVSICAALGCDLHYMVYGTYSSAQGRLEHAYNALAHLRIAVDELNKI